MILKGRYMMRAVVYHEVWGEIVYEESEWSGKKSITVGGQRLEKIKRGLYYFPEHQDIFVQVIGNYFWGGSDIHKNRENRYNSNWY